MVGFGYDIHKLSSGESLILGGIRIDSELGTVAHSDGDVVLHSLVDALLGAAGLDDIGEHFPDADQKYKDADSSYFVIQALNLIKKKNYKIINIDITIVLEKPKLSFYKESIKLNIATLCGIEPEFVNIKAKTSEKLGYLGRSEGIASYCITELQ